MLKILIKHEIGQQLIGFKFRFSIIMVILMFAVTTISYISDYSSNINSQTQLAAKSDEMMSNIAEDSATKLAITKSNHRLFSRKSAFMASSSEDVMPNQISYNAFNVYGYSTATGKSNVLLLPLSSVNWQFIIIVFISFISIIFSYNLVSGEKEDKTLSLCFTNTLSRGTFLLAKYISANIIVLLLTLIGVITGLIILLLSSSLSFTSDIWIEVGLFSLLTMIFISCMVAIGLLSSVITYNSNISLLASLTVWLVFMVVIPNSAVQFSRQVFPIESANSVEQRRSSAHKEVEASFPPGKWSSNSSNPFLPNHKIRANMQMGFMESDKRIDDEWYNSQFQQYEQTRKLTWFSPFSIFEYGCEVLLDGGFTRFQKNWKGMQNYQVQFLQFFKELDAKDDKSPHWHNPVEGYSTTAKPVNFSEVPRYSERKTTITERFSKIGVSILVMISYTLLMLLFVMIRFNKYDLR